MRSLGIRFLRRRPNPWHAHKAAEKEYRKIRRPHSHPARRWLQIWRSLEKMKKTNKNKKRIPPLKWKLFSFFAAFAAAILLLLWILQIWHLDDFYVAITKRNLIRSGTELAAASSEELQATADSIALDNEICVLIFDNSGKKRNWNRRRDRFNAQGWENKNWDYFGIWKEVL